MKRLRIPTVVFCIALAALSIIGIAVAQAAPSGSQADPTTTSMPPLIPGLDKPVEQFTEADLQRYVDLGLGSKLSKEQIDVTFKRLNATQKAIVKRMVEDEGNRRLAVTPAPSPKDDEAAQSSGFSGSLDGYWDQKIEYGPLSNDVLPFTWYTTTYVCDGDADLDWVFVFAFNPSNPDALSWETSNLGLYFAILVANQDDPEMEGADVKGFGVHEGSDVSLCLGTTSVSAAGGSDLVSSQIYVGWKN